MLFTEISGNEAIKTYLRKGLATHSLHHTLLFSGAHCPEKMLLARSLAKELLGRSGEHPDLHLYQPEGKSGMHSIESLRELIEEVRKPPFEAPRKVFIIEKVERMHLAAANALLKTLEEPELDSMIILIADQSQELIPTLVSRCVQLHFEENSNSVQKTKVEEIFLAALEKKTPYFQALEEIELCWEGIQGAALQKEVQNVLSFYLSWVRDQEIKGNKSIAEALVKVSSVKAALERNIKPFSCLHYLLI